jgi:hypothetical protein
VANEVADPECRAVAARTVKELNRVADEGKTVPPKKVCSCVLRVACCVAGDCGWCVCCVRPLTRGLLSCVLTLAAACWCCLLACYVK